MREFSLKNFSLYIALSLGCMLALLPLIWMIVIACKQQGQALKFDFLPGKVAVTSPYRIIVGAPKPQVTFQYYNPSAQSVFVKTSFNQWQEVELNGAAGLFTTTFDEVTPGDYLYSFIVDGETVGDPQQATKDENGNARIHVEGAVSSNVKLRNATTANANQIIFKFQTTAEQPAQQPVKARLDDGREFELAGPDADGYYRATLNGASAGEYSYRFTYARGFWQGMGEIYTYRNFIDILFNRDFPFIRFFLNSLIVATLAGLFTVTLCTMAGYVFAKKEFYGKKALFFTFLGAMLVPGLIFMVPQFALVNKFGWINSYMGMIVPHIANVFGLYLLRQYIETIPNSLVEAAKIDGASEWQIFSQIIVPLSMPIMMTLFLLVFVGQWSNFLWQYITNTPDSPLRTLPVGLSLFKGQYDIRWEQMMAGACFSILPITILFVIAQRFFIEGMTSGAVKE